MQTAVIVRFHYQEGDPRFDWRFAYFKACVLPRLMRQTDNDFVIAVRCNPCHEDMFLALNEFMPGKIITFQTKNDEARYKQSKNGKKYFEDFVKWEDVIGLPKFDLQIGLDSDDLIGPDYIKIIKQHAVGQHAVHVCFQPALFDLKTLHIKPMLRYHAQRGSAFMALYQPDKVNYHFIYERSHISLGQLAQKSVVIPAGHCWATAHYINESTGV